MKAPERLWRALESVPGLTASKIEWESLLGHDFPLLEPLLRPTGQIAASHPCPDSAKPGSRHKVVQHGPDDIVSVCPEGCPTVSLRRSDVLIYEVNLPGLAGAVAAAFEIAPQVEPVTGASLTLRVGTWSPTAGYRFPVYLTVQVEPEDFGHAVERLALRHDEPFILVAPTHDLRSPTSDTVLKRKGACFFALCDIFQLSSDGRLQISGTANELLARFKEAVLPSPEDASGKVFFLTPPDATWEDLSIKFRDAHTVSVNCKGVQGVYHYAQIGMADGRNGGSTKQWDLLYDFGLSHGHLVWKSAGASPRNKKRRENLAADLRAFFRIDGDPIEYDPATRGWRARFAVSLD